MIRSTHLRSLDQNQQRQKKRRTGSRRHASSPILSVTSYIDVVFLLLIYFVATASFAQGEGVMTVEFPARRWDLGVPDRLVQSIKINVYAVGKTQYRLAVSQLPTDPTSFAQLKQQLHALHHGNATTDAGLYDLNTPVVIQPQAGTRWQHALNAYNAAVAAGYKDVAFAHATD